MEARTPAPEGEAVAWRLRRVGVTRWNLWDLDPRTDTAVYADQAQWEVQPLYASPVVPVGREEIVRLIENNICALRHGPSSGWLELLGIDDAADAILAALGMKATDTGRE